MTDHRPWITGRFQPGLANTSATFNHSLPGSPGCVGGHLRLVGVAWDPFRICAPLASVPGPFSIFGPVTAGVQVVMVRLSHSGSQAFPADAVPATPPGLQARTTSPRTTDTPTAFQSGWISIAAAAEYMDCSIRTVNRLACSGRLVCGRLGAQLRFRYQDLDRYLLGPQATSITEDGLRSFIDQSTRSN